MLTPKMTIGKYPSSSKNVLRQSKIEVRLRVFHTELFFLHLPSIIALDYEGIYRKTGGSGQSKAITQMFERGDYDAFDLRDSDRFNDICSVTSVLKTYFRSLPIPLLTFDLHDQFMTAIAIRDPVFKQKSLIEVVNMLPNEHYYTLRMLMLHLNRYLDFTFQIFPSIKHLSHRVCGLADKNLMNGRNLGVVFGRELCHWTVSY